MLVVDEAMDAGILEQMIVGREFPYSSRLDKPNFVKVWELLQTVCDKEQTKLFLLTAFDEAPRDRFFRKRVNGSRDFIH